MNNPPESAISRTVFVRGISGLVHLPLSVMLMIVCHER